MKIYDSLYDNVDDATNEKIEKIFASKVKYICVACCTETKGYKDCGLFLIACATRFQQDKMHHHLIECLKMAPNISCMASL